jgi:Domain of unknown function (DUF1918)
VVLGWSLGSSRASWGDLRDAAGAPRNRRRREGIRKAKVGDRVVTEGAHVDSPRRLGRVVGVSGQHGEPPYRVQWTDGHESLWFPGPDSRVLSDDEAASSR